ncbi:MAG: hypothetical protein PVF56_19830 [Desulfobacterales bacterium]|jgi:hypothetical protein
MLQDITLKIREIVQDAQKALPVESAAAIESVYGDILNLNNSINKKLKIIENDVTLTAGAKRTAKRKLLENTRRELEALKSKKKYLAMIEELESKLPVKSIEKEESILKFLREKEIRDRLVFMTERQILSQFGDSLFDGSNPLMIDAILNAPPGFEILPERDLKKLRELRVKKLDPEISTEIETVRNLQEVILQMFNLVQDEMDKLRKKELPLSIVKLKMGQNS